MERETRIRIAPASVVVSVDEVVDGLLKGSYLHVSQDIRKPFNSLAGLMLDLDVLMDDLGVPQSYMELRTWDEPHKVRNHREPRKTGDERSTHLLREGKIATFILYISFRRNSSWQGEVIWAEKKKRVSFRSVLELLHLIYCACGEKAYRNFGMPPSNEDNEAECHFSPEEPCCAVSAEGIWAGKNFCKGDRP